MFGIFKKKFQKTKAAASVSLVKTENKDLMEAVCAGVVLVGYSSGDFSDKEEAKAKSVVSNHSTLQHFGAEINETIDRYARMYEGGKRTAKHNLMKEISDIKCDHDEKLQVLMIVLDVADSDDKIDDDEIAIIREIGNTLGIPNVEQYI